ncbi:hypothetical protein [Rhodothermus bifroesti]|nr:hypothetical protein [Rhodothermus bifroesti]
MSRAIQLMALTIGLLWVAPINAQPLIDTLWVWQGYQAEGRCRVQLYRTAPRAERAYVVVLRELAENPGPSTVADARYLAEHVGRRLGVDPTQAYWIFHWGAFSFKGAQPSAKELFLRATFSRTSSGRLSAPHWHIVERAEVEHLTDRQLRIP